MNLKDKKALLRKFFEMLLDAAKEEKRDQRSFDEKSKDFEFLLKQIKSKVKPSELEALILSCYQDIFFADKLKFLIVQRLPELTEVSFEKYQNTYFFEEETSKIFYSRKGIREEVIVDHLDKFKKNVDQIVGEQRKVDLTKENVEKLFKDNGGHSPDRLINQIEARRIINGSEHLIRSMYEQEEKQTKAKAFCLTILACLPIVTIPFVGLIYNLAHRHFYNKQSFNLFWSNRDIITKINDQVKPPELHPLEPLSINPESIFRIHEEEIKTEHDRRRDHNKFGYKNSHLVPYIKKEDIFNKCGELRKISSDYSEFMYNSSMGGMSLHFGTKQQRLRFFGECKDQRESKAQSKEQIQSVLRKLR